MGNKHETIYEIDKFLDSDEKGILITGSNAYEKHLLVMALLEKHYSGAKILFRINGMQNITDGAFLGSVGVNKQPKAGEQIQIGHNYYEFDSLINRGTWDKTGRDFDFAICYPVDALAWKKNSEPIEELFKYKNIGKIFLCSWVDQPDYGYSFLRQFYSRNIAYNEAEKDK